MTDVLDEEKTRNFDPNFVILAAQRTGSTMLTSMLNSHPELRCFGELYARDRSTAIEVFADLPAKLRDRFLYDDEERTRRWRHLLHGIGWRQKVAWGFKLMNNQHKRVRRYLIEESDCLLIVLKRRNALAMHASSENAKLNRQCGRDRDGGVTPARAVFNRDNFLWHLDRYESRYQMVEQAIRAAGRKFLATDYETLKGAGGHDEQTRILTYLGVAPRNLVANTIKRESGNVLDRFENPDVAWTCIDQLGHPEWNND